jgi:hypothetical protein
MTWLQATKWKSVQLRLSVTLHDRRWAVVHATCPTGMIRFLTTDIAVTSWLFDYPCLAYY